MSTVQIVGIVVAAAIVLLLIIALLVTRHRGSGNAESAGAAHASFLDDAPQDTLDGLGKAEQPVEDITIDPGVQRAAAPPANAAPAATLTASAEGREHGALGLDWGPSHDPPTFHAPPPPAPVDEGTAVELPVEASVEDHVPAIPETPGPVSESGVAARTTPAKPIEDEPAASTEAAPETGAVDRRVPLSDIIVTTSNKLVDLHDPEVRHMLTDLVKYEIDQATLFRQQGQTIDAVLQLTEAEKISRALDMRESAAAIRQMMQDLEGQV